MTEEQKKKRPWFLRGPRILGRPFGSFAVIMLAFVLQIVGAASRGAKFYESPCFIAAFFYAWVLFEGYASFGSGYNQGLIDSLNAVSEWVDEMGEAVKAGKTPKDSVIRLLRHIGSKEEPSIFGKERHKTIPPMEFEEDEPKPAA